MGKLDLDFAALLVGLSLFTGVVWAIDQFAFRKKRLARNPEAKEPVLVEYCRSFFPVIFAVLIIRSFLAEPFRIPSSSMMPTLLIGDFILVNKFAYGIRLPVVNEKIISLGEPHRGDVIVFRYPGEYPGDPETGTDFIKRVIGEPGDEITYRDHVLYVNGTPVPNEQVGTYEGKGQGRDMTGAELRLEHLPEVEHQVLHSYAGQAHDSTWRVPAGHYFVLGDNRDNSRDSRFWGFVPEENLVGKAFLIWMNWDSQAGYIDFHRLGTVIH